MVLPFCSIPLYDRVWVLRKADCIVVVYGTIAANCVQLDMSSEIVLLWRKSEEGGKARGKAVHCDVRNKVDAIHREIWFISLGFESEQFD